MSRHHLICQICRSIDAVETWYLADRRRNDDKAICSPVSLRVTVWPVAANAAWHSPNSPRPPGGALLPVRQPAKFSM